MEVWREVKKRWFIVSLVAVILLAKAYPYLGSKEGECFIVCRIEIINSVLYRANASCNHCEIHCSIHDILQQWTFSENRGIISSGFYIFFMIILVRPSVRNSHVPSVNSACTSLSNHTPSSSSQLP